MPLPPACFIGKAVTLIPSISCLFVGDGVGESCFLND